MVDGLSRVEGILWLYGKCQLGGWLMVGCCWFVAWLLLVCSVRW
jgi:hypothetical protein